MRFVQVFMSFMSVLYRSVVQLQARERVLARELILFARDDD